MTDEPLSPAELRRHPVTQLLRAAALGEIPSDEDLDALELPQADRRRVDDAAVVIAATKASGENAKARQLAEEAAEEIVNSLPADLVDPDYLKSDPDEHVTDPAQLAARVPRGW